MRPIKASETGINLIKRFEGFSASPYICPAGVPTIGYGFTYYPNGKRVTMQDSPISEEWAEEVLRRLLQEYELATDSLTRDDLTQNQFDALVSFCYNVGVTNFRHSTLLKLVNTNPTEPNIAKQFRRWNKSNGRVIKGLVKRREAEIALYFA